MLEIKKKKLALSIDGQEFSLAFPNVKQIMAYDASLKSSANVYESIIELLASLGLPKEVSENMDVESLRLIIDAVSGKKN
jgi:hypothetical protein